MTPRTLADFVNSIDDLADQSVLFGGLRRKPEIAAGIVLDFLERLAGLAREHAIQTLSHGENFPRLDFDVGRLPTHPSSGLVQQKACVGQAITLVLRHCDVDKRAGAG